MQPPMIDFGGCKRIVDDYSHHAANQRIRCRILQLANLTTILCRGLNPQLTLMYRDRTVKSFRCVFRGCHMSCGFGANLRHIMRQCLYFDKIA